KEDWTECQKLFEKIADLRKRNHTGGKASILLSATPLIPMPHTPMQFSAFPDETMVKNGIKNLKEIAHKHHLLFRESISLDEARMAQLLLFADGKHAEILTKNIALGTYQHDMPERLIHGLMKQLESHWMEWVWREKKLEDKFPWDMLYTSDEKSKLYSIYNHLKSDPTLKTLQFKKPPEKKPCPIVKHHAKTNVIFSHWFLLKIEPQLAGIPIRFFQVALARALMMSEPRLADIYLRPGPTINDLRTIPTSGIRIASLQFQPMPGELLQKAVSKLIPQWGWKLMKTKESIYNSTASGVLMEMNGSDVWMEKSYQEIIQRFDQSSIRYHRNKTHSSQTIQIDKSSTKKIGFDLISWDFGKQCLQWLITDDVRASGFIKKSSITRKWENGGDTFQIITWLGKETANKSQNRSMGWVNSFDGSPFQLNANENS
ncbi:hypothetical protein KKA14_12770, partial [bacterium]|nr:hypothetical protein [bacterium]